MRKILLIMATAVCFSTAASAQTYEIARNGFWTAYKGHSNARTPVCGIFSSGTDRTMHFKWYWPDAFMIVHVFKDTWRIPEGVEIPVRISIDRYGPWVATAIRHGERSIEWQIPIDNVDQFEREFRAGNQLVLEFLQGNEQPWVSNLRGSWGIMDAFSRCMAALNRENNAPTSQPFGNQRTQPF